MTEPLYVHFFTLTDTNASEHVYMSALVDTLTDREVIAVDNWRDADIVHLFEVNFYSYAAQIEFNYPKLLRILRSDTPVVASTDDLYFIDRPELTARPWLYLLNHYTQLWLFRNCDAVIAISESVKRALAEYLPVAKLHVIRHGVARRYLNDDPPTEPPFVLHVSLAAKRKNPDAIVETARRLNAPFIVAGSGWADHFDGVPETGNVDVRGYVPEEDLIDLYHRAAIFYFPTRHEGFGLPILEAMAANTAIVTSDVYSVPEVTGNAAMLHAPDDIDAHVETIERLLNDEDTRRELAEAARTRAATFTWSDAAKQTERMYKSICYD